VECLRDELYEVRVSASLSEDTLRHAQQGHNTNLAAAEQKAKEAKQLGAALQSKEEELQRERMGLDEVKSQLALKDTTLTEAQAHAKSNARRLRMHRLTSLRLSKRPKQHRIINLSIFGNYATIYENV
jgi:hypothetical protein